MKVPDTLAIRPETYAALLLGIATAKEELPSSAARARLLEAKRMLDEDVVPQISIGDDMERMRPQ